MFLLVSLYASHDDLRTNSSASSSAEKTKGKFSEISGEYGYIRSRTESLHLPWF